MSSQQSSEAAAEPFLMSLDLLLVTANHHDQPWDLYFSLMKPHGTVVMLAAPEKPISFSAGSLFSEIQLAGSLIGSRRTIEEMLKFAADNKVLPLIEIRPMSQVNEALQHVRAGKPRYRVVLQN